MPKIRLNVISWLVLVVLALSLLPTPTLAAPSAAPALQGSTFPVPAVAIHVSELTQTLETTPASSPTPTGVGTTGYQWWIPWWHYFVMYESLKEALRSDGTPFVTVSDADIAAGRLLNSDGSPKYPIVISLASEAIADTEIVPLRNYVAAGGFVMVGSSAFTRNPNGTTRGDFALANEMGLHIVNASLQNWVQNTAFTKVTEHRLVSHIPSGRLIWRMPLYADQQPWIIFPSYVIHGANYVWQVQASNALVLANGDSGPLLTAKAYGQGQFIYHGALEPLIGHGGYDAGMYAYGIYRSAIEWAFESAHLPLVKLSPWRYSYDAAFIVRHDFENTPSLIQSIEASAQAENAAGAKGDYYFATGTVRVGSEDTQLSNTQKTQVIASIKRAVSLYGATIGSHNGGLKNPSNTSLLPSDYQYWHWGPDEALDTHPAGYTSGKAYATTSINTSFQDIQGWLAGTDNGRPGCGAAGNCPRTWVSPFFNSARENSYDILEQLGSITMGEQKIGPFPHWTISTQTAGKRYSHVTLPVSDWFVGPEVAQSAEEHTTATMQAMVDFYYDLGALINLYAHSPSNSGLPQQYITYAAAKPRIWATNAVGVYDWWKARSDVVVTPTYSTSGGTIIAGASITGATDPQTSIELVIPSDASSIVSDVQVFINGAPASPADYRATSSGLKVRVGASGSAVEVRYTTAATTLFSDDFTRQPQDPNPLSPWTSQLGTWTVANGVLRGSNTTNQYAHAFYSPLPAWTDYSVQARFQFPAGAFGGGIGGRLDPATGAHYAAWIYPDGSAGGSNMLKLVKLRDWTSWSGTPMQQVSLPSVGTGWHTLQLAFNGNRIGVYYDGALLIDVTDNNFDARPAYLSGGISVGAWINTTSYLMTVDDVTVQAPSGSAAYTLTTNLVGSGTVARNPDQATYGSGTVVTLTATPAAGWTFAGWSGDLTGSANPQTITINANKVVTATFTQNQYALTVNLVGSGTVARNPDQATYGSGTVVTLTATPAAGWTFAGWSGDLTGSTNPQTITINANKVVTATFTQNQYALTVNLVGSGTVTRNPDQATYGSGTVVTLTATPAAGWTFAGWSGDLTGSTNPQTITINANKVVTATFTQNQYALTVNLVGSGAVTRNPDQATYGSGTVVTLTATPAAGWSFAGWSGDLTGSTNPQTITINANKVVTATFTQNQYALTVNLVGSGTVARNPDQATYGSGTVVTLTATPAAGWSFAGWTGDLTGSTNPQTITIDANKVVTATFTQNQYALTVNLVGSGTVTRNPDQATYGSGTVVTLTATPAAGWSFAGWSGDLTGSTNPQTITIDANKVVTATFTQGQYTLVVPLVGSGSVTKSPDQATYGSGTVVTLTATPAAGWTFAGWSGDLTGNTNPQTITINANKVVTATFTATTLFSDDFTRQPQDPNPLSPWTSQLGTWTVANGVLQGSSAPIQYAHAFYSPLPAWTDYSVQARFQFPAGAFGGGIGGRLDPATGAHYAAWIYPDGSAGGSNVLKLVKLRDWTSWSGTPMQQVSLPSVGTGWHTLQLAFNVNRIGVYYDGALLIDVTDNNFDARPAYLSGGISVGAWTNTTSYLMTVDDVTVQAPSGSAAYTLTTNLVGSGTVARNPDQATYGSGTVVTLTATPAAGWSFAGWSGDLTGSTNPQTITIDANKVVTATFTQNQYALTVNLVGSGTVARNPDQATYGSGTVVTLTATPAAGWSFAGWTGDLTGSTNPQTITINANKVVTATFTQNQYALTVNLVGSGTVTRNPDQATYGSGTVVTLTATPAAGWSFAGWSGDLTGSTNPQTITINANKVVTATFTQNQYALTVNLVGSGAVTRNPDQATYGSGTVVTLTATPAAGWSFAGWSGDLTGSTNPQTITINANKVVTATFTQGQYALTVNLVGSGTVARNPDQATYGSGTVVTLTATPAAGWSFAGWSGDLTGNTNPQTITIDANKVVTATFSDVIFADGFESGDLSRWSSASTDLGNLSADATAALVGASGLQAVINDNNSMYVTDDAPNAESHYQARFYFDPNSISMTNGNAHYIFYGYSGTTTIVLRIEFRFSSPNYQLRAGLINSSGTWRNTGWFSIGDAPHFVEIGWQAATAAGANNGYLTLWIDGTQRANLTGVNNNTRRIDRVRLGPVSGIDSGTRGTYYFDAFESRRQTYIGP